MTEGLQTDIKIVANKAEIPSGENFIRFNNGHTTQLREARLIGNESEYLVNGSRTPCASVNINTFLENEVLVKNQTITHPSFLNRDLSKNRDSDEQSPAQDFLFGIIGEELRQIGPLRNIEETWQQIESGEMPIVPGRGAKLVAKMEGYKDDITVEHNSAMAIRSLLQRLSGPQTEYRQDVSIDIDAKLNESVDTKNERAERLVVEIKRKLGI